MTTTVHTIGHSKHPIEVFIGLLRRHGVATLVDVRSRPHSRWAPQFKKSALESSLAAAGIEYVFLGQDLGGRPDGAEYYDPEGHVDYRRLASSPRFRAGVDRLAGIARQSATAIMCAEEDPNQCHRRLLIAPVLRRRDVTVLHIRGDGRVQSEDDLGDVAAQLPLFEP